MSLSDIGLNYFPELVQAGKIIDAFGEEELNHLTKVMRRKAGDEIFVTDGKGRLLQGVITGITKQKLTFEIATENFQKNRFERFTVLLPLLKNPDRFEFALEKCIELGFTNFKVVKFQHSVKSSINLTRISGKGVAAMKQSLRTFLPGIVFCPDLISALVNGERPIYFDQFAQNGMLEGFKDDSRNYSLVVGPEGGFSANELEILRPGQCYRLSDGRLRAETALVTSASVLANMLEFQ